MELRVLEVVLVPVGAVPQLHAQEVACLRVKARAMAHVSVHAVVARAIAKDVVEHAAHHVLENVI